MKIIKKIFLTTLSVGLLASCSSQNPTPAPSKNEYLVQFNTDKGSFIPTQRVEENDTITKPNNPTRAGSEFLRWTHNGKVFDDDDFAKPVTEDITLKAEWSGEPVPVDNYCLVSFDTDGGTYIPAQVVELNAHAELPTEPEKKEGDFSYEFDGWYHGEETTTFDFEHTAITDNITLNAHWKGTPPAPPKNYHVVDFNTDGGSYIAAQRVEDGKTAFDPGAPTKTIGDFSYTFGGWYADSSFTGPVYDFATPVVANLILYAKWTGTPPEPVIKHYVTFESNGGTHIEPEEVIDNKPVSKPTPDPTKTDGSEFGGWYDNASCSGNAYNFNTPVTSDLTLYAKWSNPTVMHTITFVMNGATSTPIEPQSVKEGEKADEPTAPSKTGYTFQKWCEDEDLNTPFSFDTAINKDYILYADWGLAKTYSIKFYDGDTKLDLDQTIHYEERVQRPVNPTKAGFTFSGWCSDKELKNLFNFDNIITDTQISEIKIYAKWDDNVFAVNFASNGGSTISPQSVKNGGTILTSPTPTYTGHTFKGWFKDDVTFTEEFKFGAAGVGTPVTSSIVLYAKWTINKINVTLDYKHDDLTDVISVDYGTIVPAQEDPTYLGHDFLGWYDAATGGNLWNFDTKITEPTTIYAHWTLAYCNIVFDPDGGHVSVDSIRVKKETKFSEIENLPTAERSGFTFMGWSAKQGAMIPPGVIREPIVLVYAIWQENGSKLIYFMKEDDTSETGYSLGWGATVARGYITNNPKAGIEILKQVEVKETYDFLGFAKSVERAEQLLVDMVYDDFYGEIPDSYGSATYMYPVFKAREHTLKITRHDKDIYTDIGTNGRYDFTINGTTIPPAVPTYTLTFKEKDSLTIHIDLIKEHDYDPALIFPSDSMRRKMFPVTCTSTMTGLTYEAPDMVYTEIDIKIERANGNLNLDAWIYLSHD